MVSKKKFANLKRKKRIIKRWHSINFGSKMIFFSHFPSTVASVIEDNTSHQMRMKKKNRSKNWRKIISLSMDYISECLLQASHMMFATKQRIHNSPYSIHCVQYAQYISSICKTKNWRKQKKILYKQWQRKNSVNELIDQICNRTCFLFNT